jgi:outer membrane protein OmpA-like peptidoglycan-associated protein/flagellar hook assembly protein FlgD
MVTLFQETSEEDTWSGKIFDQNGNEVDSYSWIERPDPKITWDGHGNDGRLLADGLYVYRLESVDRAGNRGMSDPVTFRLNTEETPVFLSAEFGQFSPNADGQKDQQRLFPQVKTAEGIQSYEITIMDARGNAVRTFTGRGGLRSEYAWDGLTDAGRRVPDGTYSAEVSILYANGNEPSAKSSPFVVDTEYPTIAVEADRRLFSPNNDGKKDTVTFTHDSSSEDLWEGRLLSNRGTVVRTVFWKGEASRFTWDGTDEAGNRAPDGTYRYVIATTDKAGNTAEAEVRSIILDTKPTPIFATASTTGFSPNGDDEFETVTIGMIVNVEEGIESWSLALAHEDGSTPKVFRGDREIPPRRITWDGRPERGRPKEGTYRGVLTVVYSKGNEPTAETTEFTLDTSPPETEISLTPTPFSPDNDGVDDELQIGLDVEDRSGIERWELQILDPRGKPFTQFAGRGSPSDQIIWDGRARDGELVQAAEDYPFEFTVTDRLANTTSVTGEIPVDVLVIRDGDKLKIRISSITFAPNSPALMTDDEEASDRNIQVLGRLAEILNKYRRYNIRIEGHAVSVYWEDEKRAEREEREELKPLSLARAQTVKDALTDLGVDGSRISVAGLGGTDPVVPHGDLENRWKNRRVEFILIR